MRRPSQQEINRVKKENRETFRLAGIDINKKGRLTKAEVARLNAALRLIRSRKGPKR